jgi:hypothetical protein
MGKNNCHISVGEPWDLTTPDGENIIKGIILRIVSSTCLLFKANYPISVGDVTGDILVLSSRYSENTFKDFGKDLGLININAGLLLNISDRDSLSEQELKTNSKFVIVGSIGKE